MKRNVIIIGSPLNDTNSVFYSGVEKDIENYYAFFTSPTGGAFTGYELSTMINPSKQDLIDCLNSESEFNEFTTVVFTGHGFEMNGNTTLNINAYESISLKEIIQNIQSGRKSIITDTCRVYPRTERYSHLMGDPQPISFRSNLTFYDARSIFDNGLKKTSPGLQILYSCKSGEPSGISQDGSYFSNALLGGIKNWSSKVERYSVLLGEGAYKCSKFHLERNPIANQTPKRGYSNERANYPFAVRLGSELLR